MPALIEYIDAIARKKQRDVLFVEFHPQDDDEDSCFPRHDWEQNPKRQTFLHWLDGHAIAWCSCAAFASENGFESSMGRIYIDLPMDETDPTYCKLRDYLEHPDGSLRDEAIRFYVLPLEMAMRNAHHDEPGFWERRAEEF
ncbi:MAG: hypothetical protein EPN89_10505 [Methylovulum sp.]|nr:MAG: hypothetical protein EPN89_10505 [Methylovulum sp.]